MTHVSDLVHEPIPISTIGGRYLLFDVDAVTYLRRSYHILGVLIGGIPQAPQQNVFLGLPVELLPEEARLLVEKKVAYIIEDTHWHQHNFTSHGADRQRYLESLRSQGRTAKRAMESANKKKQENALIKHAAARARKNTSKEAAAISTEDLDSGPLEYERQEESLFGADRPSSRASSERSAQISKDYHAITPAISYSSVTSPQIDTSQLLPVATPGYPLFKHLHDKDYFMMPGLRFGCNYNVYPGDPLRFHSHFLAVGYGWEQEIPLLDLIGGGRLGTAVKKGFLIGGKKDDGGEEEGDGVRTFCLEWGGM